MPALAQPLHLKLVEDQADDHPSTTLSMRQQVGQILCRTQSLSPEALTQALDIQKKKDVRLGNILVSRNMVSGAQLLAALSEQHALPIADFEDYPVDQDLLDRFDAEIYLKHGFIPWRDSGGKIQIALTDPARREQIQDLLPDGFGPVEWSISTTSALQQQVAITRQSELANRAENICPGKLSCRSWARPLGRPLIIAVFASLIALGFLFPRTAMWLLFLWVMLNLVAMSVLRLTALVQQFKSWIRKRKLRISPQTPPPPSIEPLPKVSVLVPLYREGAILAKLIDRLSQTDYPKELLDICLVLEEGDKTTRKALQRVRLPSWMRVIEAPPARLRTKPRAMNYALDFCFGDIVGIYDAEDAPESDQISRIVAHFRRVGPEIACIQSYLDYYNPKQNWLSRCFTIEYAIWFRLVLQGVERMRLPVPLGGTSVFFRREVLEELGAWDAHNVTEDADLGMRLARFGYRCAFEPTTTYEEANCHAIPWIKQRSRWLKGYAMTWITHMRNPRELWHDLGPKGFLTFNVILLGTLSSFLLAPAIWSFWLLAFGFEPAFAELLPATAWHVLGVSFVGSEILQAILGVVATSGKGHRNLIGWVPTMVFYWPLGTLAAYKAIYELLLAPFYWDKTKHGIS
ncbi:MAG: glycosyltransferase [Alphaproteobacteria bacterium]|nr:glycosyltransferase [Alphaproteobacteria bacterium]